MPQLSKFLLLVIFAVKVFFHSAEGNSFERVVTDLIDVYHGVPLNFGYNESKSNSGLSSAPGCPKSEEGHPWLYYASNDSTKCYLAGSTGPCLGTRSNDGLFVVNTKHSHYGVCGCECFDPIQENIDNRSKEEKHKKPHRFCRNKWGGVMALIPEYKPDCFHIPSQGPCEEGKNLANEDELNYTTRPLPNAIETWYGKLYCKDIPCYNNYGITPSYGPPNYILPMDCDQGLKYSHLLKKCVKTAGKNVWLGK